LKRVKGRQRGERRELTAKVRLDTGSGQFANCLRPMLNQLGLDFDMPPDGALEGATVEWKLVEGGEQVNTRGNYGITPA